MNKDALKYELRGVSASKEDVHEAVKNLDHGLFPKAFSKVFPDFLGGNPAFCNMMSSDGSGTKSILAYLYWKETGELSVWKGIAQDAIVMNLDDLLCVGATGPFLFSSVINRNKNNIPGEIITSIVEGGKQFLESLQQFGIEVYYLGGETADLGDIVKTITVDGSMTCRMKRNKIIQAGNIQKDDVIIGLASSGVTSYDKNYNSGIGSNGLTSARHDILSKHYFEKYKETFDSSIPTDVIYSGTKQLTDKSLVSGVDIGKLLLTPTRTYAPFVKKLIDSEIPDIHALIHCTGGAQTKILHFIDDLHVVKNNMFEIPPVFNLIQSESKTEWKEMYKVFNMGHRLEIYCPEKVADKVIKIADDLMIESRIVGYVTNSKSKKLTIESEKGKFEYS